MSHVSEPDKNNMSQVLLHSCGKEEKWKLRKIEFCAFLISLFKQFSIALPCILRRNYKDLCATHADESDMVCFVTKFIAFLIFHSFLPTRILYKSD